MAHPQQKPELAALLHSPETRLQTAVMLLHLEWSIVEKANASGLLHFGMDAGRTLATVRAEFDAGFEQNSRHFGRAEKAEALRIMQGVRAIVDRHIVEVKSLDVDLDTVRAEIDTLAGV